MPAVTRSFAMHHVFNYLPVGTVLECNAVCKRWYKNEIPKFFSEVNCLNTVVIKVGHQSQMISDTVNDHKGFEPRANHTATLENVEF